MSAVVWMMLALSILCDVRSRVQKDAWCRFFDSVASLGFMVCFIIGAIRELL